MAVTWMCGFESASNSVEGFSVNGDSPTYDTTTVRTGSRSIRCNPGSGISMGLQPLSGTFTNVRLHFAYRVATAPSVARRIAGSPTTGFLGLYATSTGLSVYKGGTGGTLIGSVALSTNTWYWIGFRQAALAGGTSTPVLQVDSVDTISTTEAASAIDGVYFGVLGADASAIDIYLDDVIADDAGFLSPSKVALLLPISDNLRTEFTNGTGGTTNLYDAVNNTPPAGLATETATSQIEHPGGGAGSGVYSANLTTYVDAGVGLADTIISLQTVVVWGEDSGTGTKLMSFSGCASNPATTGYGQTDVDVSTGDGSGATLDYAGTGTDKWNEQRGQVYSSSLRHNVGDPICNFNNSPTMSVSRTETASRVASVCFMGMIVAWTPAAAARVPRFSSYPQLLAH